jgi:hypothetical protein
VCLDEINSSTKVDFTTRSIATYLENQQFPHQPRSVANLESADELGFASDVCGMIAMLSEQQ